MSISKDRPNGLTKYRVDQLEQKVNNLDDNVTKILENHLPHLKEQIVGLSTQIKVFTAINIIGFILGIIAVRAFK